jgi:TolA-binding protein
LPIVRQDTGRKPLVSIAGQNQWEELQAMTSGWNTTRKTISGLLLASVAVALVPSPAAAQDSDARLRRIESQINALQRAVFPGGDGRYFTPEVDTSQPPPQTPAQRTPSSTALTDMLARLDALESQLAGLTARAEENANQLAQLEAELKAMREQRTTAQVAVAPPTGVIPLPSENRVAASATPTPPPAAASAPSAARLAAVQAIAKPSTADAGDDEYSYGFRLWEAGFYPEARQQLSLFLQKYPNHARASFGRNLLGRAFLDDGKPREAATEFLGNYQKDKNGARAADSLLFLSEAMVAIGDTNRACIALAEFSEAYPALATGRLKEQYDRNRSKVTCN